MTISISKENEVIVLDPDEKKAERTRKLLDKSMKNIAVISTMCLHGRRKKITGLMNDADYDKMFYGCDVKFFNKNVVERFNSKGEVIHLGWKLNVFEIMRYYWHKKGFEIFPPTISRREESFGQEL